jgi:hypothetical protein
MPKPAPANRRTWELAILASATRFIVSTPVLGQRQRGQRMEWDKVDFLVWHAGIDHPEHDASHQNALSRASAYARNHTQAERALVYAVNDTTGEQFPLSKKDWL